jgi:hypothetical protein
MKKNMTGERTTMNRAITQLSQIVDSGNYGAVLTEVRRLMLCYYSQSCVKTIDNIYNHISMLFRGDFAGYAACNTEYHNLQHTLDAALACARLIDGYNISEKAISEHSAKKLIIAALLHDTGYIQEDWDVEGTGAKFTRNHVERSVDFLRKNRGKINIDDSDASSISRIIRCTGLSINLDEISFASDEERTVGRMMGTADLLGQMSDRQYLEKLLFLYNEFREAQIPGFETEYDIIVKTLDFYELAKSRFNETYDGIYHYAQKHFKERYGAKRNLYMDSIDRHIEYLKKIVDNNSTNFRHKLKRAKWIDPHSRKGLH